MSRILHAVFSEDAARKFGSVIYARANGNLVEVCVVGEDKQKLLDGYKWPDKVYVGEVEQYMRPGRPGKYK